MDNPFKINGLGVICREGEVFISDPYLEAGRTRYNAVVRYLIAEGFIDGKLKTLRVNVCRKKF